MPSAVVLALVASQTLSVGCVDLPKPTINVVAAPSSVKVGSDFTLEQLADLAQQPPGTRAPIGFYSANITQSVSTRFTDGPGFACMARIWIQVDIQLVDRRIEIARELRQQPCRYSVALDHYRKKARADQSAFVAYVKSIARILQRTPLPDAALADDRQGSVDRTLVEHWVKGIVDQNLPRLRLARVTAQQSVDKPEEMRRVDEACSTRA